MTPEEKKSFGWLGKPPPELWLASGHVLREWKKLAKEAGRVATMRYSAKKVELAKAIERRRNDLIEMAIAQVRSTNVERDRNPAGQVSDPKAPD